METPTAVPASPASFVPADLLARLHGLTRVEADAQPFGVIRVDDAGVIQLYNRYESELAGVDPAKAEGLNFFTRIAPCTNNRLFFGRFQDGVAANQLDQTFAYTFTYKMRATNVLVHLYRTPGPSPSNWLFIKAR